MFVLDEDGQNNNVKLSVWGSIDNETNNTLTARVEKLEYFKVNYLGFLLSFIFLY